jgi:heat shock protein HslJ
MVRREGGIMRITIFIAVVTLFALTACSNKNDVSASGNGSNIKNVWWRLESFEPLTGGTITLATDDVYLVLFADSGLTGKTDSRCSNYYQATYWVGCSDSLSIGVIVSTEALCRPTYWGYLKALEKAVSFVINDNRLTIFHSGGTRKLEFVKQ